MPKRLWIYLAGFCILVLSKILVPLVLYTVTRVWNLPEQTVGYCLAKGPGFLASIGFILFGFDNLLCPERALLSWGPQRAGKGGKEMIQIAGIAILVIGMVMLYLTFFTKMGALYSDDWPPLPYPTPIR
jgi:hypothetical protein